MELEEKWIQARDAAMPVYEQGLQLAKDVGVDPNNEWVARMKERLSDINPESDALNIQIVKWIPTERAKQYDEEGNEIVPRGRDPEYDRSVRRIQNILGMNISVDEKISQLNRIKMEAERNIKFEEERISELRAKAGS